MIFENDNLDDVILYDVSDFFKVFGEYTRLKILICLLDKEMSVNNLAEMLSMTQSAVSHQLKVLRQNGFVRFRKDGKESLYSLDDNHIVELLKQGIYHVKHKKNY